MENTGRLKVKDLINVGIYTAIYLVIFFVVGMLNAIPVFYPLLYVIWPIVCGIPFMLFLTKTQKFGMLSIMSVILGVFWFLTGYTWIPILSYLVCGLIADFVLKSGDFKSFKKSVIGYWIFSCGMIGLQAPMWFMADRYMADVRAYMGDQYAQQLAYYMPQWMGFASIAIIFVGSLLGALLGRKMLKKHFERAGIA
ncbi:MptD family putative ECF transporter S component [Sinanaerobacter sp. ZZT-01]|uniref:MptD family putative ECF transporter S component n=1 Tax=Sinanaerobacter sp. ZZT-01 TaxID=3111540 RepID=UPI002D7862C1|nr:MptD family putative ECF transporter S component [Sinanaerobacter sp. ZZT-01]WRR94947.1 MptD family putative ECF transporter S component [Sinanaerobacter sp. ZZT-01]